MLDIIDEYVINIATIYLMEIINRRRVEGLCVTITENIDSIFSLKLLLFILYHVSVLFLVVSQWMDEFHVEFIQ